MTSASATKNQRPKEAVTEDLPEPISASPRPRVRVPTAVLVQRTEKVAG